MCGSDEENGLSQADELEFALEERNRIRMESMQD